jgi:two-component system, cell cycle response regulator
MKALIAEDSGFYQRLLPRYLSQWGFESVVAANGSDAWKLLCSPDAPRLALLDWVLPGVDGLELCRRIRSGDLGERYVYTILLTGNNDKGHLLDGMRAGADDFLGKPFDPPELQVRLMAGRRILDVQTELIQTRERLHYAATHDLLTGLFNRGEIVSFLKRELLRAGREKQPLGVILGDIDHFKKVNDTLGHAAGDEVLKKVAARLRGELRAHDGVGRYGGEEFLMVLPGCDVETTLRRADEVRRSVCALPATHSSHVTVSMGVAGANPHQQCNADLMLKCADAAMYRAKELGRNRVQHSVCTPFCPHLLAIQPRCHNERRASAVPAPQVTLAN